MINLTVEVISIVSILIIISSITKLISRYTKIPFTILLVIVGFLISYLTKEQSFVKQLTDYKGYPDILLFVCLPTLIFEAAFTMDGRLLQKNIVPILSLAIPGLFISTTLIGIIVSTFTHLNFLTSLLLGSILSATDSVAVIAIFRQFGVPKRLAILIEGESLFNSSTAFVVLKTILFVMLSSTFSTENIVLNSVYLFCFNFFGGILVGLITAFVINYLISLMQDDVLIVISLTVILAYLSFIIAETILRVSGIMAAITAGLAMAYWGKTKFTSDTEKFIHTTFGFLSYIVNSLIFILVGFSIDPSLLFHSLPIIAFVIITLLIARAVMIFGFIPIISKLPNFTPINNRYKTITWLSGIQGAIGLTMVLSINMVPEQQLLISIVMGVVLFTIIIQGSLMGKLIHWLKLDKMVLSDQFAKIEAEIAAENTTINQIHQLQKGGLFSSHIANNLGIACNMNILKRKEELQKLKGKRLTDKKIRQLLFLLCLGKEKNAYYEMFSKGNLSEQTFRILNQVIAIEIDLMRFQGKLPNKPVASQFRHKLLKAGIRFVEKIPLLSKITSNSRIYYSIIDYEKIWGLHQSCIAVIEYLDIIQENKTIAAHIVQDVRTIYLKWLKITQEYLNDVAYQFPAFVKDIQNRFIKRILLYAKYESIMNQVQQGLLPQIIADEITKKYLVQIRQLSRQHPEKLNLDPRSLLRQVPFFKNISNKEMKAIIPLLKKHEASPKEIIIRQGDIGDRLYFILRGLISVIKNIDGKHTEVATLMAGDFFGEFALLNNTKRTATCEAITHCILYVLTRKDFEILVKQFPNIEKIIYEEYTKRQEENDFQ